MPYPQNVKDFHCFLGMINCLGRHIPNLTVSTENLRKLLVKDTIWYFDENHKTEIDNLKALVTDSPVLKFYNPLFPIKISCDASLKVKEQY